MTGPRPDHDPAGRARLDAALAAARRRVRAVRLRPGPGRHGGVLRGLRVRAGGLGQHDRRHRQERSAALRRVRRCWRRTGSTSTGPSATGSGRARRRSRRPRTTRGTHRHADRRRDGVRAAGRAADLGRCAGDGARADRARRRVAVVEGHRAAGDPAGAAGRRGGRGAGDRADGRSRSGGFDRSWPRSRIVPARDRPTGRCSTRAGSDLERPPNRPRTRRRPDPAAPTARPARSSTRARTSSPSAARASAASGSSSSCSASSSS